MNEQRMTGFNRGPRSGTFQDMVLAQYEINRNIVVDAENLKTTFETRSCSGIPKLIDFLMTEDGSRFLEIETGIITLNNDNDAVNMGKIAHDMIEKGMMPFSTTIGIKQRGISPLMWLAYFSQSLQHIPEDQLMALDEVCDTLAEGYSSPTINIDDKLN